MRGHKTSRHRIASAAFALALGVAAATSTLPTAAQKSKEKKPPEVPSVFVEDRGTLQIRVDGQPAGTEEFEIRSNGGEWTARGNAEVPGENGATSKVTGKLELTPEGAPLRYEWTTTNPKKAAATIVFVGTQAKMELKLEGASPYTQEFNFQTPPVVILDNNMYHQYAVLARIYDWEHREAKTYSVLIPQDLTPGSVSVEYGGAQAVDGQKLDLLRVHTTDLEIELYCDNGRMVRLEVPSAKAVVVRQAGKK